MARRQKEQQNSYWISYSDLMAGLLILFIMISIFALLGFRDKEENLNKEKNKMEKTKIALEKTKKELEKTKEELKENREDLRKIFNVKAKIISLLTEELKKINKEVEINKETGSIVIKDTLLFDYNQSKIKQDGKVFLKQFFPVYLDILLGKKEIREHIAEIIIEGHTDDKGNELYNIKLSQERALSVSNFLLKDNFNHPYKKILKKKLTVVGKGEYHLKKLINGKIDRDKSRRVEFKFRLNEEEIFTKLKDMIEITSKI